MAGEGAGDDKRFPFEQVGAAFGRFGRHGHLQPGVAQPLYDVAVYRVGKILHHVLRDARTDVFCGGKLLTCGVHECVNVGKRLRHFLRYRVADKRDG